MKKTSRGNSSSTENKKKNIKRRFLTNINMHYKAEQEKMPSNHLSLSLVQLSESKKKEEERTSSAPINMLQKEAERN